MSNSLTARHGSFNTRLTARVAAASVLTPHLGVFGCLNVWSRDVMKFLFGFSRTLLSLSIRRPRTQSNHLRELFCNAFLCVVRLQKRIVRDRWISANQSALMQATRRIKIAPTNHLPQSPASICCYLSSA
jgi:hypothetical protein